MKAIVTIIDDDGRVLKKDALVFPRDHEESAIYTTYRFEFHCAVLKRDKIVLDEWAGDPEIQKHFAEKGAINEKLRNGTNDK